MVGAKNVSHDKKLAIIVECAKYHDHVSGKLVPGGLKAICTMFAPISPASVKRYFADFKNGGWNQNSTRWSQTTHWTGQ